jgi:putative Holliday junction resolvase
MILARDLEEFGKSLVRGHRLIGLDIGRKTVGIAISDRDWNYATPAVVLLRKNIVYDITAIKNYAKKNTVCGIVCGIPFGKNNEETRMSLLVKNFIRNLERSLDLPIYGSNEYLTSFAAREFLIGEMSTRYKKTEKIVDKVAASYILQDVLDSLRTLQ